MIEQTLAIVRNTFFESIRQPIMLVVLLVAGLLIILANPLSAFTMEDDQRMLIHMGLSTVFTGGALLASFIATSVLSREIENKTALTVISKPVGRPLFVIGKYLGVAAAMVAGTAFMAFVFLLTEMHGALQTVRDPYHLPVLAFGVGGAVVGVGIGVWCNYFYGMAFSSTVICATTPLLGLGYFLCLFFRFDFTPMPPAYNFDGSLWLALTSLTVAILVLTAIAVAASTRLGQVLTLCVTIGVFLLGMLSDWIFGRHMAGLKTVWLERAEAAGTTTTETVIREIHLTTGELNPVPVEQLVSSVPLSDYASAGEMITYGLAKVGYAIVPNFQVMWLADALTQKHVIPGSYVVTSMLYGVTYIVIALGVAVILFQRREVG